MSLGRLADNDKRFGPLTISTSNQKWNAFYLYFEAFYDEDYDQKVYNTLSIHFFTWFVIRLVLPVLIKPIQYKVYPKNWSKETIERLGRDYYWEYRSKRYGFLFNNTHANFVFGKTRNDTGMLVERSKHWDYPWKGLNPITLEVYDHNNNLFSYVPTMCGMYKLELPSTYFELEDFDGERIIVSVRKEVRVYSRFQGFMKPLGKLLPKVRFPNMDIRFSKEVGPKKGSWKGGTVGHGIDLIGEESNYEAMQRYCEKYGLKFIGFAGFGFGEYKKKEVA